MVQRRTGTLGWSNVGKVGQACDMVGWRKEEALKGETGSLLGREGQRSDGGVG